MMVKNARAAALEILCRCRTGGAWSADLIAAQLQKQSFSGRDLSLITAIVYGTLENLYYLDFLIRQYKNPGIKTEPKVQEILRLSVYQILFLDRIPDRAAISEAVELCRSSGFSRATGFVNAILRRISAEKLNLPAIEGNVAERLSVRYSHHISIVEEYLRDFGADETERIFVFEQTVPDICCRVNTLKTTQSELVDALLSEGVSAAKHAWSKKHVVISSAHDLTTLRAFRDGSFFVQDPAATEAVSAAGITDSQKILDVCAAPGGKTFSAMIDAGGCAELIACDLHENKLKRINEGAIRLGLHGINALCADASAYCPEWSESFDTVIADVPCSGLGVIQKKPEIRYKSIPDFQELPAIQLRILENVCNYVKPGGVLLYSTCTTRIAENENVVRSFLSSHTEFSTEEFLIADGSGSKDGMLRFMPGDRGCDGFFIAKMRKAID